MATKKSTKTTKSTKKSAPAKKNASKKAAPKKVVATKAKEAAPVADELRDLDRKGLAQKARQLKTELLAVRFNIQSPSLQEYRKKKKSLARVLAALG